MQQMKLTRDLNREVMVVVLHCNSYKPCCGSSCHSYKLQNQLLFLSALGPVSLALAFLVLVHGDDNVADEDDIGEHSGQATGIGGVS